MPALIAPGITELNSADVIVASGSVETLILLGRGTIYVDFKNSLGAYVQAGAVNEVNPSYQVAGPVTYRARRPLVPVPWAPVGGPVNAPEPVGLDQVVA